MPVSLVPNTKLMVPATLSKIGRIERNALMTQCDRPRQFRFELIERADQRPPLTPFCLPPHKSC